MKRDKRDQGKKTRLRIKNTFILFLPVLLLISCDKYSDGDFSGVLASDIDGVIWGQLGNDDGDWELNDEFTAKEEALFEDAFVIDSSKLIDFVCSEDTAATSVAWRTISPPKAYPTLTTDFMSFSFGYDETNTIFKMVIVDDDYDALLEFEHESDALGSLSFKVKMEDIGVTLDRVHRVYYKVLIDGNQENCGHGDFIFTEDTEVYW